MPFGTAGGAIPPGQEDVRGLVHQVTRGDDPAEVLQRALEVYQSPNLLPPNTVIGPDDQMDFATTAGGESKAKYRTPAEAYHRYMSEIRRHPKSGKYRVRAEYFMPVTDGEKRK